jgi:hypothetical protein
MALLLDSDSITMEKTSGPGSQDPDPPLPTQNVSTRMTRAANTNKADVSRSSTGVAWLKPDEEDMVHIQVDADPESAIKSMLEDRSGN